MLRQLSVLKKVLSNITQYFAGHGLISSANIQAWLYMKCLPKYPYSEKPLLS